MPPYRSIPLHPPTANSLLADGGAHTILYLFSVALWLQGPHKGKRCHSVGLGNGSVGDFLKQWLVKNETEHKRIGTSQWFIVYSIRPLPDIFCRKAANRSRYHITSYISYVQKVFSRYDAALYQIVNSGDAMRQTDLIRHRASPASRHSNGKDGLLG